MNSGNTEWIVVGKFGRPHGLHGAVSVYSFTDPCDNLLQYKHWHAVIGNKKEPLNILRVEAKNKCLLAYIDGYPSRDEAAMLTNIEIAVQASELALLEPGEYYWHQLVGLRVINKNGIELGVVSEVLATGSNDVLVVSGDSRLLIPYLPEEIIINVDLATHCMTVDWDRDF